MLDNAGFTGLRFMQTLTAHPLYSDLAEEQPQEGYGKGDYVAIVAVKPF